MSGACEVRDYEQNRIVGEIHLDGRILIMGEDKRYDRELANLVSEKVITNPVEKYLFSALNYLHAFRYRKY
ncbi:MAG: hypothetical protein QF362_02810 [Candidatus Woesearchaeota archaeon]|jgi:hypothetical protein|nr:hypothetical protein [Candidatus Woesearchaeota archaeon]MDP7506348.1 hypothetical protein [Candidatus Woesearchaeota archaeon]|tara:strand:+ start:965 stop:1177 length:213 start_codon:yes stop_codon:yes gene_type:complete